MGPLNTSLRQGEKLVRVVFHRWISTCNVIEEFLRSWTALQDSSKKNEQEGSFPLAVRKMEIEELFSLVTPIAVLMKCSEQGGVPTCPDTFLPLITHRRTSLDASKSFTIAMPRKTLAGKNGTTTTTNGERPAASLQAMTKYTREKLAIHRDERALIGQALR